jgi:hypothetical protein
MRNGLIGREFLLSASIRLCRVERLVDAFFRQMDQRCGA